MDFEQKWTEALRKRGMLQGIERTVPNRYNPDHKSIFLHLEKSRKTVWKRKPFSIAALVQKWPASKSYFIKLKDITNERFKTKADAISAIDFLVRNQPMSNITFKKVYKDGGRINVVNEGMVFDKKKYQAIFGDFDKDGLVNIDDAEPLKKSKRRKKVEQVEISKTFEKLLDLKEDLDKTMGKTIDKLDKFSPKGSVIYARTKTPFSIVKKLVDKRLTDPKKGLSDLIGTTIATEDYADLVVVRNQIRKGVLGKVIEEENMYNEPKSGYRAYHFIVEVNGTPVEIQLKTKRMKAVNEYSHEPYKKGTVDVPFQEKLTALVVKADREDKKAISELQKWLDNPEKLKAALDLDYKK